jgi:aminoglycoside 6'-N-acetyltransferase I
MTAVRDDPRPDDLDVRIREIVESDRIDWVRLRTALWPGSLSDHEDETRKHFEHPDKCPIILVAEAERRLVGFLELDYRKYAPGCRSSPVPFIEGWYVAPGWQGRGIGRALIVAAEACARAAGHREIASDTEVENAGGIAAHLALGYEEVERVVCFRRSLPDT